MFGTTFKFREFVPASTQVILDTAPRISGEEVGSFYEEVINTKRCENVNVASEAKVECSSVSRVSSVPQSCKPSHSKPTESTRPKSIKPKESTRPTEISVGYFFQCAQDGDVAGLRHCFQGGLGIDARDSYGWTALMCAASSGATSSVKFLLEHGADGKVFDRSGVTALRLARNGGHSEILKLILDSPSQPVACTVKVKIEKPEPASSTRSEHFCELCKTTVRGTTQEKHSSSTVHLFAGHKARACRTHYHIPESNVGFQIMVKDGWNKDDGLGPSGSGMKYPPKTVLKRDRNGLGSNSKSKARITHFGPRDLNAVKYHRLSRTPVQTTSVSKQERLEKERTDKLKEIEFRRMWYSQD